MNSNTIQLIPLNKITMRYLAIKKTLLDRILSNCLKYVKKKDKKANKLFFVQIRVLFPVSSCAHWEIAKMTEKSELTHPSWTLFNVKKDVLSMAI